MVTSDNRQFLKLSYRESAFTIVELLIVIVVIGILAAITIVAYGSIQRRASGTLLQSDLSNAAKQLAMDNTIHGDYPATTDVANDGKGLPRSNGTSYQYTYTAADNSYCLTATSEKAGVAVYHISNTSGSLEDGVCPGHTPPGPEIVYAVGDTGPAGGIVFYDKGSKSDGWRYLEASPSDLEGGQDYEWGCYGTTVTGADGTAIGTGKQNTVDIVAQNCSLSKVGTQVAATAADNYSYGGYGDWFLPSQGELDQLYLQRNVVGGFAGLLYWSSSEIDTTLAGYRLFGSGGYNYGKAGNNYVRAIRAF